MADPAHHDGGTGPKIGGKNLSNQMDDFREIRKTKKGAVESADIKAKFSLDQD
jgi:hypothetical protein